jgi:hypothetical protein
VEKPTPGVALSQTKQRPSGLRGAELLRFAQEFGFATRRIDYRSVSFGAERNLRNGIC